MDIVILNKTGVNRVLGGKVGMTFVVDKYSLAKDNSKIAHVIDYRYTLQSAKTFSIWSIPERGYSTLYEGYYNDGI